MMRRLFSTTVVVLSVVVPHAAELTVAGAWTLNRHLTTVPLESERAPDPDSGRRDIDGGTAGAAAARNRFPGFRGGWDRKDEEHRLVEVIRRRLTEIPDRLVITTTENEVTITDGLGRSYSLNSDGKKQERVTGDGEFTSRTRFDGPSLVVLDDLGGPQVTTTYTPTVEGGEIKRLTVTIKADRLPGEARDRLARRVSQSGGNPSAREVTRVYDAGAK